MSDRSYQGTSSRSDSSYDVGTESNVWGCEAHHNLSQVRLGEGGIQFPRISESGARNEYKAVRGEGTELGRKWRVSRPVARYFVKEFVTAGHDWKGCVGYWVGSPLVALEEEKKAWKRARSLERRLASSFNEFVPESFLVAQEALIHSQPQVPRGNRLDVRIVEKSSTGQSRLHLEGTECLALFARGHHHQTLCLASLCARGRRGGHRGGIEVETGGTDNCARTSRESPSACGPSTALDLHTTIQQVRLEDYTERSQGGGGGGMLYAARSKSSIFCGIVRTDVERALSMRPLFDMSTKPSDLLPSWVCLNPFWPELSFGTCCGKICGVDVERAGTTAACAKYATKRARMEALQSCIVGRIRVSTGDFPVFHVYGKDPYTLVCCSNTSVFLADLRSHGGGLGSVYRHPKLCRYQGIDKDPFGRGAPHLISLVTQEEVQIFDERYMKPLVTWRAPSQAYLVSSAIQSSQSSIGSGSGSLDFAADGVVLASGSVLSEATLYPFGGERPGNGAGGSAHIKTFFDIPRDSVFGPGMLLGHSVGGLASSGDAVDRLTLMDAVTTQGEGSRAEASSSLGGRPKVRVPDPKACIGIKAICDPEHKSFILCSLAGDLGLSISHASALAEGGGNDWDKKSWRHYETIPCSGTEISAKDREGSSGQGLSNLGVNRGNATDLTLYGNLNSLTREVNAHAPQSPGDPPATAYEILLDAPATRAVGGGGVANGPKETIFRSHRSHMEPVGEDDAIGQALDLLSTVLDIDLESFWPRHPEPAQDDGESSDAQGVLSRLWREHCTQASGLWH